MLDTHCHLDAPRFDPDRLEVLDRARAAGVGRVLIPGTHAAQWPVLRRFAREQGQLFAVGTHPHCLPEGREVPTDLDGAVAIGECGLDAPTPVPMAEQIAVLEAHLALARESGLPVILHCFRAHPAMLETLARWAPLRGVVHSYSGGPELVTNYVRLGLHLSFAGAINNPEARKPVEALRRVPRDHLLVETDAPSQCPRPHQGRNEPAWLVDIVARMEAIRGEALGPTLSANAAALGWQEVDPAVTIGTVPPSP